MNANPATISPTCTLPWHSLILIVPFHPSLSQISFFLLWAVSPNSSDFLIHPQPHPRASLFFFTPSPPSPLPHSGPCHCLFAVEVRVVHNYVIHRDLDETRLRTHTSTARERQRWDVGHAMLLCTPLRQTHTHSHPPTPTPPLCSSRTATRKCKRTGSAGAHCKFTAHNQHRG